MCSITNKDDEIIIENRFGEPDDFQVSTEIYVEAGQNLRLTIEFTDYVADLVQDNSVARSSIETYLDFGNNIISQKTKMLCLEDCLKGIYHGNLDVENSNPQAGKYKLILNVHAFVQDKLILKLVSIGDLVLSSKIYPESKGADESISYKLTRK